MHPDILQIRMLGELSLRSGAQEISDSDNRSRKVWLLLAYLICSRGRVLSQEELIRLLWSDEDASANPTNALKTIFHRLRTTLDALGESRGRELILRREGGYVWNTAVPAKLDIDTFETLCKGAGAGSAQPDLALQALELYQGDFLPKLASEPWVVPIGSYYHALYLQTAEETAEGLMALGRYEETIALCRRAIELDESEEALYQFLMRALLKAGRQADAAAVYQEMSRLLFASYGVTPSDESKALYREAMRSVGGNELEIGFMQEQLQEEQTKHGALFCDYDFFTILCQSQSRALVRSGDAVQLALLTISGEKGPLPRRSLEVCVENLRLLLCGNLRQGDIVSRCSVSQFAVLLLQTNYENACRVLDRVIRSFTRQYPHSPAVLRYSVQPLRPLM